MGIPKFFRYISERYPCLSEMLKDYQIPEFDNLYLDMNGIIHACSHPNDSDINFHITNDEIFNNIFHYIEILFGMIQPQKLFFIAIDGVAPRAKINQQRARRFRAAKGTEMQKAKAKASGIDLKEELFDSNCITPGTVFMSEISKRLKYFITYKVSTDKLWQKCKVLFSGPEVVGEGEHKIMDYIRYLKSQIDYDPNIRHCLYGLDADLIMLGLCTHERNFSLLREEVKFGKKQKKVLTPEETKFCLLHLSLLREYLNHEFSPIEDKLSFPFNIEHIIDDWVLMGFLVGNDFIPNLPNLNITNGALPILYHVYMEVLPTLEGYINESGRLRLDRFEIFMERLSRIDIENFAEYYCDLKYLEAKMNKNKNTENDEQISQKDEDSSKNCSPSIKVGNLIRSSINMEMQDAEEEKIKYSHDDGLDYESDSDTYNMEFILHKRDYYMNKLEYEDVNEDVLRSQAEGYVRAIQWNLHYYYNGCCSWSWYYPHHYAPYISDIKGFKDLKFDFELGEPFKPFQQLLAVLPSYSKQLLPEALQSLLTEEESPIIDYYPSDFKTDLNGKKQDWEAIVLIPFIDEKILTEAMEPYYVKLTVEEHERNKHGPMYMYSYDKEILGLCHLPGNLPVIENHAQIKIINREDIYVPKEKLVKGLHPRVKCDIHYPGFPTLKYIKHTANLKKAKVKVFEQPSRGDNMILYIQQQEEPNLRQLAASLLHKTIFVEWPYLREAHIVGVSNHKWRINLINPQKEYSSDNIVEEELKGACAVQWTSEIKSIVETYKNRFGIDVGKTNILIHAQPLIGSKYIFAAQGKLSVEKQWQEMPTFYAYQTIVKDISTYCVNPLLYKTIDEIFVPGSNCFMLGHPHYGAMGEVIGPKINMNSGRIKIYVKVVTEPDLAVVKQAYTESKIQYIYGSTAAQRLGISSHLLSRITGTIYIMQNNTNEIINVGLNLKFNKKNEEIPGYTKKENGQWLYSIKAVDLIRDYMAKCPGLFERLAQNITNDVFNEDELFDKSSNELNSIIAWLKEQHFRGVESRPCGANILEADIVQKIEQEVDKYYEMYNDSNKAVVIQVKPQLLFKPELYSRQLPPDPKSHTRLLDRIVCIRGSFTVPIGYKGTIIGIQKTKAIIDSIYDVLFDKSFLGGLTFNGCSEHRGYKLSITDFINISHGERVERGKSGIENTSIETTDSWRRYQNAKNQVHSNVKPITQHKPSYELQHASKQLSSEFQQLWNELHKIEDSSGSSKTSNTSIVESNEINKQKSKQISQDPSAFLKEVLKISDDNTLINLPTKSSGTSANKNQSQIHKSSDAPPLVQKLFDYARQKRNEVKDDKNSIWYCSHLLNHYQILGMGLPRYDYFLNEQTNLIQAQILLPDAKVYLGDPCLTHAQAAESAARKVYEELNLEKVQKPDMKLLLKPPSQQWVNMRQNSSWSQNIRPPMVLPYISKPYQTSDNPVAHCSKWNMKMQQNPGFAHMAPHNSQIKVQTRQKTNESKSEIKNSTSFVPLQAQKKSRNVNTRQTNKETIQNHANSSQSGKQLAKQQETKETTFPKPPKASNVNKTVEKEVRVQNNLQSSPKLQKSERPKRSRVAAKFVSPPATNGSEQ